MNSLYVTAMCDAQTEIMSYECYRLFLRDYYENKKKQRGGYSYRKFSRDFGFSSANHLYLVIEGKRNLSDDAIVRIKSLIKGTAQEKRYFETLVRYNQATTDVEKQKNKAKLDDIKAMCRAVVDDKKYSYLSGWHIPVIREMIALKGFVPSLDWVEKNIYPPVKRAKIREAFQILQKLGMLEKKAGRWIQKDPHLTTPPLVSSDIVFAYQQETLDLSQKAIHIGGGKRNISTMTLGLTQKQYEWLDKRINDFRDEIQQELQDTPETNTTVAMLNIQLFPVIRR